MCSYLWAGGTGLLFVLTIFPHDLLTLHAVPDARLTGDVAQHVIGQRAFFSDRWHWPLLRTTLLDAPEGLNVAMTDSNPLVALPLKLVGGVLPDGFSAVQLWLALAYFLQPLAAVFALRSAGETRLVPAIAVSLFAISMPSFLYRHPHSALSSHFIVLAAVGCYFRITRRLRGRTVLPLLLLPASFLVHPYLAAMTFAVLLAAPVTFALRAEFAAAVQAGRTFLASLLMTVFLGYLLGYTAATPSGGFGEVSMNAISPFYPTFSYMFGRGLTFADATGSQYEGYQYLGAGLLLLLVVCLVAACLSTRTQFLRRHSGIALASICLTALALSNVVYWGQHRLLDLEPVPLMLHQIRASGRLFWPVAYCLMIGSVATAARILPPPLAWVVLVGAALIQMRDVRDLNRTIKRDLRATISLPLDPGRLDKLLDAHDRLTILPTFGCGANAVVPEFMQLLLASTRHRVPANTMYVARFARLQVCGDSATAQSPLSPGELRVFLPIEAAAGPLAVPDGARLCRALAAVSVCSLRTDVLAGLASPAIPTVPMGKDIGTNTSGLKAILGPGWYMPEPEGVWTVDRNALISTQLEPSPPGNLTLTARASGFTGMHGTDQRVNLSVNGHDVATWEVPDREPGTFSASIPHADLVSGPQLLHFQLTSPTRPSDIGINRDTRELAFFLESLRFDAVD